MTYDGRKTFSDFEKEVGGVGASVITHVKRARELFDELQAYKGGDSNAVIATRLNVDVTWIDDLETAVTALKNIHDFADGSTGIAEGNYLNDLRLFT